MSQFAQQDGKPLLSVRKGEKCAIVLDPYVHLRKITDAKKTKGIVP